MLQILTWFLGIGSALVMLISLIAELEGQAQAVDEGQLSDYTKAWAWVCFISVDLIAMVSVTIWLGSHNV